MAVFKKFYKKEGTCGNEEKRAIHTAPHVARSYFLLESTLMKFSLMFF